MKDIVKNILDYLREENIKPADTPKEIRKILNEVYSEIFTDGIFVIKKDLRVENFQEDKMFYSIANASDTCGMPLTESDIRNIISNVKHLVREDGNYSVSTGELRDIVIDELNKSNYGKVADCYLKN